MQVCEIKLLSFNIMFYIVAYKIFICIFDIYKIFIYVSIFMRFLYMDILIIIYMCIFTYTANIIAETQV